MSKYKIKPEYTYTSIVAPVSASTSALSTNRADERLYSPPSKTKSVSFLLHDTFDPRRRHSSELARDHVASASWRRNVGDHDVSMTATFPRRVARRNIIYDRIRKEDLLNGCAQCGSTPFRLTQMEQPVYVSKTMTPERKYIECTPVDDFRTNALYLRSPDDEPTFDNCDGRESPCQPIEVHAVSIEHLPACEVCSRGQVDLLPQNQNVYFIKDGVCENCACACSCPVSSSSSHFKCGRSFSPYQNHADIEYDSYGCYDGKPRDFETSVSDEGVIISASGDVFYQSSSLTLDGSHQTSFSSCMKFLWPCLYLHRIQREISVSPPLPPPPPPPPSSSQETLSTRFPTSSSLKSKSIDGLDERKKVPIHYSVISYSSSSSLIDRRCSKIPKRTIFVFVLFIAAVFGLTTTNMLNVDDYEERINFVSQLLNNTILVDGHNDLAWNIRMYKHNLLNRYNYDQNLKLVHPWNTSNWSHTDLPRLRDGRVGAQMWSAYTHCESQFKDAIQMALEQIDLIRRFTKFYHHMFDLCLSYDDVMEASRQRKVCSIITLEGGHNIANSLAVLRMYYDLGVRSMALTNKDCSTPWAESAEMERRVDNRTFPVIGLSKFGLTVINELNRLGIVIDLSGTSANTMRDALTASKAPVVFSHSNARTVCNVTQNVPDDIIRLLVQNKGVIMVTFYPAYLNCKNDASISNVIEHINYLRQVAGVDHIGIGSGFDGIDSVPNNLNDTSYFPKLFIELTAPGNPKWQPEELKKLAGLNILRVLRDVEKVRDSMKNVLPYEDVFKRFNNRTSGRRYDPEMRVCISHNHILN